jgi:hypothetical protein
MKGWMLMKMNKVNGLVATFKDGASSDSEKDSSYNLICKMIEKETGCERWVSANIFNGIIDGEFAINNHMQNTINKWHGTNHDIVEVLSRTIEKLNFKYCVETIKCLKNDNWMKKIVLK